MVTVGHHLDNSWNREQPRYGYSRTSFRSQLEKKATKIWLQSDIIYIAVELKAIMMANLES